MESEAIKNGDTIKILALEQTYSRNLKHKNLPFEVLIKGNVDRIEERNGCIRIIDYKTGKVEPKNLALRTWNGLSNDIKNDKIIQILAYAYMFDNKTEMLLEAGIISFKNLKAGFMPFAFKVDRVSNSIINDSVMDNYVNEIVILLSEILDKNIPFEEKIL